MYIHIYFYIYIYIVLYYTGQSLIAENASIFARVAQKSSRHLSDGLSHIKGHSHETEEQLRFAASNRTNAAIFGIYQSTVGIRALNCCFLLLFCRTSKQTAS